MKNDLQSQFQEYVEKMKVLKAFYSAESLISWDRETHMPKGSIADRGQVLSVLAGFSHDLATDPQFISLVNSLHEQKDQLNEVQRRSISVIKRSLDKDVKLPKKFVEETNEVLNAAHGAWLEAKQKDDFALFQPHLEKVLENRKQYAAYIDPNTDPYDVSLDDYEEGLTAAKLEKVFPPLKAGLLELLPQILEKQKSYGQVKSSLDEVNLDSHQLEEFLVSLLQKIGFDMNRGALGRVEHPFEISISHNDVRLNTHYEEKNHSFTVTGMVHELGHGLYEQNADQKYVDAFLGHGVSLGIHESQSRLLENCIGRSSAFWNFFFPQLQERFPQLKSSSVENLVRSLNLVQPSLVRTEADEVTYNFHIIVRFELEKSLLRGELQVKDLPEAWRARMKEFLGLEPETHREGVLQDVHWSWGNFGYFPTYTLGNLNAAQLFTQFEKDHPQWAAEVEKGDFSSYFSWFKNHVWQYGSFSTPDEVMTKATGESTNAKYLLEYLKKKYLA